MIEFSLTLHFEDAHLLHFLILLHLSSKLTLYFINYPIYVLYLLIGYKLNVGPDVANQFKDSSNFLLLAYFYIILYSLINSIKSLSPKSIKYSSKSKGYIVFISTFTTNYFYELKRVPNTLKVSNTLLIFS